MSLKSTFLRLLGVASAVAGSALTHAVVTVAQKGNPIGAAAIAAVAAAEQPGVSGADKKKSAMAAVVPVVTAELAKAGLTALVTDVEQFASMVIEEILAQAKKTGPLAIALQLLALFSK